MGKKKWAMNYSVGDVHCLEKLLSMGYARDTARRALEDPNSEDAISLRELVQDLRELYNGVTELPDTKLHDEVLPENAAAVSDREAASESDDDEWDLLSERSESVTLASGVPLGSDRDNEWTLVHRDADDSVTADSEALLDCMLDDDCTSVASDAEFATKACRGPYAMAKSAPKTYAQAALSRSGAVTPATSVAAKIKMPPLTAQQRPAHTQPAIPKSQRGQKLPRWSEAGVFFT